jgi:hypothetical protein
MKKVIFALFVATFIASCGTSTPSENEVLVIDTVAVTVDTAVVDTAVVDTAVVDTLK